MSGIYATPRVPPATVSRARLSQALSTTAPLVVVRAPAGSGKTVAVADWANRMGADAVGAWFTVDEASASRVAFWQALLQVMHDAHLLPRGGVLASSFATLDSESDLRRVLLRGFAQLPQQVLLVVDDLHVADDPLVRDDLIAVIEATPRLRVVAITRLRSDIELDAVAIRLGSSTIDTAQLMFTAAETSELLEQLGFEDDDGALSDALYRAVGGLPLTTRGVLVLMQRREFDLDSGSVQQRLEVAGAEVLRDVWAMQTGEDREVDFVIRCSVPDAFTLDLAERLTGRTDAATVLGVAESMGVGMWSESADGPMFAFSPAIRDELRRELWRRFPLEAPDLTRSTIHWHVDRGEHYPALRLAIEIEDFPLAEDVVLRGYRGFLRPRGENAREILESIPLNTLRKSPLLTMLLALALNASGKHRIRAIELFGLAVASARMKGDKVDPGQRMVLKTIESAALRVMGNSSISVSAAERAVSQYGDLTLAQKDQLAELAPLLLAQNGISFFYAGQPARALELFKSAYAMPSDPASASQVHALSLTAGLHALNGDMPDALALVRVAREAEWPDGQREGYLGALYQVAEGALALEAGDFAKALAHVTRLEPHLETIEHWPLLMQVKCLAMLGLGQAPAATISLTAALGRGSRPSLPVHLRAGLDATRSLLFVASGQLRSAEDALKRHSKRVPQVAIQWARLHLMLGKPDLARRTLQPLDDQGLGSRLQAELFLLHAATALRLGETKAAIKKLETTIALMDDRGLRLPFLLLPENDREALTVAAHEADLSLGALADFEEAGLLPSSLTSPVVLTERERFVLQSLTTNSSAVDIAAAHFVSVNTVKSQLRSLYRKLGATSREEALRRAGEQGLLHS